MEEKTKLKEYELEEYDDFMKSLSVQTKNIKKPSSEVRDITQEEVNNALNKVASEYVHKTNSKKFDTLDPCCGSRMFWRDKKCPGVMFADNRELEDTLCDGRKLEIKPDVVMDFRKMNLASNQFRLVVFDPPHMKSLGKNSWMAKKYGVLGETWRDDLRKGFSECFRVLKDGGILIFKWNESDIKVKEVLELVDYKDLFGHPSGKLQKTHWICFMKHSLYLNKTKEKE